MENLRSLEKSAPLRSAPLRVLVVDNYPDAAGSTVQLLRAWGFDAKASLGANHALEAFDSQPFFLLPSLPWRRPKR